ncbi:hypothetical protein QP101_06800 [Aerococcus urinae]|nr:hypothetical protein [Aerococcus urinae]MDK6371786.1 hypothetical protein [Aerococcus urinae]
MASVRTNVVPHLASFKRLVRLIAYYPVIHIACLVMANDQLQSATTA